MQCDNCNVMLHYNFNKMFTFDQEHIFFNLNFVLNFQSAPVSGLPLQILAWGGPKGGTRVRWGGGIARDSRKINRALLQGYKSLIMSYIWVY